MISIFINLVLRGGGGRYIYRKARVDGGGLASRY